MSIVIEEKNYAFFESTKGIFIDGMKKIDFQE